MAGDSFLFYLVALPAVLLLGLSKGGFAGISVLALPLMALVIPPIEAAAIILPILMVQDTISVWAYRNSYNTSVVAVLLAGCLGGIVLGAILASRVSNALIELIVGLVSAGFVLNTWLQKSSKPDQPKPLRVGPGLFWGLCAGFTSFIANSGAPPFQVYVLPLKLPPQIFAGTATMFFAITNIIKMITFYFLGQLNIKDLETSAILIAAGSA